jgi:hypothetical protein
MMKDIRRKHASVSSTAVLRTEASKFYLGCGLEHDLGTQEAHFMLARRGRRTAGQ